MAIYGYLMTNNMSIGTTATHFLKHRLHIASTALTQSLLPRSETIRFNVNVTNSTPGTAKNHTSEIIPLLTLFTTWPKQNNKSLNLTLRNWAHFKPLVRPVFFSPNGTSTKDVLAHEWEVLPVSKTAAGIPVLKNMFIDVMSKYRSVFYGYCNGDILFDGGLIDTLLTIANASLRDDTPILIIGRRTNVVNVTEQESRDASNLSTIAKKRGKLFMTLAEDYFITSPSFPWADIPGVVIGRRAYDNWIVLNSCKNNHTVIDATGSMLALHLTTKDGNFEGSKRQNANYNWNLLYNLYKSIRYVAGATTCAPWTTNYVHVGRNTLHRTVRLSRRRKLHISCYQYQY